MTHKSCSFFLCLILSFLGTSVLNGQQLQSSTFTGNFSAVSESDKINTAALTAQIFFGNSLKTNRSIFNKTLGSESLNYQFCEVFFEYNIKVPSCPNAKDGSIAFQITEGKAPFQVSYEGPVSGEGETSKFEFTITDLIAGKYNIIIEDSGGCATLITITIPEPLQLNYSAAQSSPACTGGSSGGILISDFVNGVGPYDISWNGPGSNDGTKFGVSSSYDIANLVGGNYLISVVDSKGCARVKSVTVNSSGPISVNISGDLVFCSDQGATSLSTNISGVSNYLWSNGTTASTLSVSSSGTYSVTVTDSNGCMGSSSVSVVKLAPLKIDLNTTLSELEESCPGSCDGKIFVKVTGGLDTKAYNYYWEGPGGYTSSIEDISGLCNGAYNLTVIDAEGCVKKLEVIIDKAISMTLSLVPTNTSCNGSNDGKIKAIFSGGKAPHSIAWSGAESGSTANVITGYTIPNLNPGSYSVTVTDSNGCPIVKTSTISQPAPFSFSAMEFSPTCQGSNTGSILVSNIINGTGPYNITWIAPSGFIDDVITSNTNYTIPNLVSGPYKIIVKDNNGCEFTLENVIVSEQSQINVSIIGDIVFCADQTQGVLSTNPPEFGFNWSTGATSKTINISSPGTYSVTVTDSGGCTGVDQVTVTVAEDITIVTNASASVLSVTCSGNCDGKISTNVAGGGGAPYSYNWTGPSGFSSSSMNISDLCPGNYSLTVTDVNGCTKSYSQEISSSGDMQIDLNPTGASCAGMADGTISTNISGGSAPFTFLWSNGSSTEDLTGLAGGTYSVTATDSNGCVANGTAVVGEGSAISGSITPASSSVCLGENVTLKASGGSGYMWSTGEATSTIVVNPTINTDYSVTISSGGSSCAVTKMATVNVIDLSGASIIISENSGLVNNDGEICEGKSVTLNATGGDSYVWTGGFSNPLIVSPASNQNYSVTITNNIGCSTVKSESILVNKKPKAIIDLSGANQVLGENQLIKNISTSNCGSLLNCEWEIDGISKSSTCADISHTFNDEGNYEVSLEVENDCGCSDNTKKIIDIYAGDACKIKSFSINDDIGEVCVNETVPIDIETEAAAGCNVTISEITAKVNGELVTSFNFEGTTITFFETGLYDLEYIFGDDCSCTRTTKRQVNVVEAPDARFADVNFTIGCVGESISIEFDDYDFGEKITIQFGDVIKTYETSIIDLFLSETGVIPLRIIRVSNAICEKEVSDQLININVIEPLKIENRFFTCDDSGLYTLTLETTGGSSEASISSSIPGIQNGDNFVISGLNPNMEFSFTMTKGEFCNPLNVYQPLVSCNCLFDPGSLDETYFLGCAGEYFDISEVYSGSDSPNSHLDTAVFVLHDGEELGVLGKVYEIYPIAQAFISNNFVNYIPNSRYILSVVGIRKFDFFNLDVGDKAVFDFKGEVDCFSVSNGIPVIWHGSRVSISGPSQVCGNAYNEIFVSAGIGDGAELDIHIPGLTEDNYTFNEADGKLYVHFVNGEELQVPIEITATTYHSDVIYEELYETTCVSGVNYNVTIDQANKSPDTSRVILWPGGIFASTDTLDNICYRWGKTTRISNTIVKDTFFEGADERFYFADMDDAEGYNARKQIWVETYFCDDPACATRNIFNGQFPVNFNGGLTKSGTTIFPNPGSGRYNLKMNNSYIGEVGILIYDIQGRQIHNSTFSKNGFIVNKEVNLLEIPKGVYIIKTIFGDGISFNEKLIKH